MIVISVIGDHKAADEEVIETIRTQVSPSRFQSLNLSHLSSVNARINQCRIATKYLLPDDIIMVISGCQTAKEIAELRNLGAYICYHYMHLTKLTVPLFKDDLLLCDGKTCPKTTYTTLDAFSECIMRQRKRKSITRKSA